VSAAFWWWAIRAEWPTCARPIDYLIVAYNNLRH